MPRRVPASQDVWDRTVCFSHAVPGAEEQESSGLEGSVFTAGYSSSDFPVPVAIVYARRVPDGPVLSVGVDSDGHFTLPAAEGVYDLGVCANGWKPWRGTVRVRRNGPKAGLFLALELGG